MARKYPGLVYNFITLMGVAIALFGLAAIIILYALSIFSKGSNPYLGIFVFLIFPGILVVGLALIPIGMWRERIRRRHGQRRVLVLDLENKHHRNMLVTFVTGTSIFLLVTTMGLYEGYHYTESEEFCGEVCHVVMEPEHTAFKNSPHARVGCVKCHIGPGAEWYVQSKISGARQVFKTALQTYPTPIPTPIENLRPAQEVCEQCHWPEKFYPASQVTLDHFLGDRENSHWQINLLLKVGGTAASPQGHPSGIHWHIDDSNRITYVATDHTRQAFEQITWLEDGEVVVYARDGESMSDEELTQKRAEGLERSLDCIDCHNRPSHNFRSPMYAVNAAMASGDLDQNIPWIKQRAVAALSEKFYTKEGARDSITASLTDFYENEGIELPAEAIDTVLGIYGRNMFPEMQVRWDRYPDNRGHFLFPGCFRCHGSDLKTESGKGISDDCNLCHTIVSQGPVGAIGDNFSATGLQFTHPIDIDGAETEMPCFECHIGDDSIY